MKFANWTFTLVIATGLSTGAWAQHGAGVHGGGGAAHDATDFGSGGPTHSSAPGSRGSDADFETRLSNNPGLSSRLQPLLPPNTTLQSAASGFKNQGQFIAALHVSQNLNIPFSQLKADMTGSGHDSLGQAIHALRPDLSSKTVTKNVKLAEHQAKADLNESTETADAAGGK
jgi:hypothetical protein